MLRVGAALLARCLIDLLHRGALAVVNGAIVRRGRRAVSTRAVSARAVSAGLCSLGCAGRLVSLLQDGEGYLLQLLAPRVDLVRVGVRVRVMVMVMVMVGVGVGVRVMVGVIVSVRVRVGVRQCSRTSPLSALVFSSSHSSASAVAALSAS